MLYHIWNWRKTLEEMHLICNLGKYKFQSGYFAVNRTKPRITHIQSWRHVGNRVPTGMSYLRYQVIPQCHVSKVVWMFINTLCHHNIFSGNSEKGLLDERDFKRINVKWEYEICCELDNEIKLSSDHKPTCYCAKFTNIYIKSIITSF